MLMIRLGVEQFSLSHWQYTTGTASALKPQVEPCPLSKAGNQLASAKGNERLTSTHNAPPQ